MRLKVTRNLLAFLTILGLLTLTVALFIAGNYPSQGMYEVDIYHAYPLIFWGFLFASLLCGFVIIYGGAFSDTPSSIWILGVVLVASVNILVLSLPILRHYAFTTQWDSVTHVSRSISLLEDQRLLGDNFYPVVHLITATLTLLTGLKLEQVALLLPVLFYLIYLANVVFLSWTLEVTTKVRILMLALALPLIFGTFSAILRPVLLAIYTLPLFTAWLLKSRQAGRQVADLIPYLMLLLVLPLTHPWAAVGMAVFLVCLIAASYFKPAVSVNKPQEFVNSLALILVFWIAWFGSFYVSKWAVARVLELVLQNLSQGHKYQIFLNAAQRVKLPIGQILTLVVFRYGPTLLYFLPVYLLVLWYLICFLRGERKIPAYRLALILFVLIFSMLSFFSIFANLLIDDPLRTMGIAATFAPLLVIPWLFDLKLQKERVYHLILACVLIALPLAGVLGILNTYSSPLVGAPNLQFSYAQQAGAKFTLEHRAHDSSLVYAILDGAKIFESVKNFRVLGYNRLRFPQWQVHPAPDHFGYRPDSLQRVFISPGYLWVTAYERAFYTQIWPEGGRFEYQDFKDIELDPAWNKIYTSGDFDLWRITGLHSPPAGANP
jgi:hypothetical protein